MGAFDVDPWEVARRHYERQMHAFMARMMRHFKVSQIELPDDIPPEAVIDIVRVHERRATFYRITGHMEFSHTAAHDEGSKK